VKRSHLLAIVLLLGAAVGYGFWRSRPRRCYQERGGFSYELPKGWWARYFCGPKYRSAFGPIINEKQTSIAATDNTHEGPLEEFVDIALAARRESRSAFTEISREDFVTADGTPGIKVTTELEENNKPLRHALYFFGRGDTKFTIICEAPVDGSGPLGPVFDAAMKTFRFDK